jgi:hypothetical protein
METPPNLKIATTPKRAIFKSIASSQLAPALHRRPEQCYAIPASANGDAPVLELNNKFNAQKASAPTFKKRQPRQW